MYFYPMSGKRLVFTTATPNDQGGIIPNEVIDFSRYKSNPVVLCQHDWNAPPIGMMTDIKEKDGKYSGIPVFHRLTKDSVEYADMYDAGFLKSCSIGGEAIWKNDSAGRTYFDAQGMKVCEKFNLYEVSMVSLPSNPDAVTEEQLSAKLYENAELGKISNSIVTLSSPYKIPQMKPEEQNKTPEQIELEAFEKAENDARIKKEALQARIAAAKLGNNSPNDPSSDQLPGVIKDIVKNHTSAMDKVINLFASLIPGIKKEANSAPTPKNEPESEIKDPTQPQPSPTGLSAKQAAAKEKAEKAKEAAEKATEAAAKAKEKAEKEGSSKEDQEAYAAAYAAAEKACNDALAAEEEFKSCMESDEEDGEDMKAKEKEKKAAAAAKAAKLAAQNPPAPVPVKKTAEQLKAEQMKLGPKPNVQARVIDMRGTTFTELSSTKNTEGRRILDRVMTSDGGSKEISDYQVVLESIMRDGKYKAITDIMRVIPNVDESKLGSYRAKNALRQDRRGGMSMRDIATQLASGTVEVLGRDNVMRTVTTLTSTDNALAAPALNTIEWLPLAIFNLFPNTSWKKDIPMFGAEMTSRNTGLIWANIAANPAVYRGNQPAIPNADYTYSDNAVALTLIPYWLQPMVWTPLTMHQLRYDQMSTGWAQAFALWGAIMDDELLYILGSTVPASSIVTTIGQQAPGVASFSLVAGQANPNGFYYNSPGGVNGYTGTLATPAYNDIMNIEQIYNNQNFDLQREKVTLVVDPTMEKFIKQDPYTKSLLTRWIESNSEDLLKISHTELNMRSRVLAYDQATGLVKDPTGALAATVISAGLGFLPSQIGMGLGMLDVFMMQDPGAYGYRMSADIRIGIVPVRAGYQGVTAYTYGVPQV